jgi:inorganic pyrophosphatase
MSNAYLAMGCAQDTKKGKLRDYHGPIFWNYGCLPQTWEDPSVRRCTPLCDPSRRFGGFGFG